MSFVRYLPEALEDMGDIWDGIAPHNRRAADCLIDHLHDGCASLRDAPELGRVRKDITPEARALIIERYLIFNRLVDDGVQIVRVVDGRRDLTKLEWPSSTGE